MKTYLEMVIDGEISQLDYLRLKGYGWIVDKLEALLKSKK